MGISNFKDAVNFINQGNYERFEYEHAKNSEGQNEPYLYNPQKESQNFSQAYDYLVNVRKLNPQIINYLHQEGLIKQDKKKYYFFISS